MNAAFALIHAPSTSGTSYTKAEVDALLGQKQTSSGLASGAFTAVGTSSGNLIARGVDGKLPSDAVPTYLLGALQFQAVWNASTNTPAIPTASSSNKGWYYRVGTSGTTNIGGITDWEGGDWLVSSGTAWDKIDNTDKVVSVNGQTGNVTIPAIPSGGNVGEVLTKTGSDSFTWQVVSGTPGASGSNGVRGSRWFTGSQDLQ